MQQNTVKWDWFMNTDTESDTKVLPLYNFMSLLMGSDSKEGALLDVFTAQVFF